MKSTSNIISLTDKIARRNQMARSPAKVHELTIEATSTARTLLTYGSNTTAGQYSRFLCINKLLKTISQLGGLKSPTKLCKALIRDLAAKGAHPYPYTRMQNQALQAKFEADTKDPPVAKEFEELVADVLNTFPDTPEKIFQLSIEQHAIGINMIDRVLSMAETYWSPGDQQIQKLQHLQTLYNAPTGMA